MKKKLGISTFLSFVILLSFQTGVTSCTKDKTVCRPDTVTITKTDTLTYIDTLVIKDTAISLDLLTANSWKMQELRGVIGNTITFYLRGGTNNTENYDNEYISFKADKTGTLYDAAGGTHRIIWEFLNNENTKLTFTVQNPAPYAGQPVMYENLRYKNKTLLFDQYWTYNGINSHAQAVRTPAN